MSDWLYERAEDAAAVGLRLDEALQAVRDGYSSIEADRWFAADEGEGEYQHLFPTPPNPGDQLIFLVNGARFGWTKAVDASGWEPVTFPRNGSRPS